MSSHKLQERVEIYASMEQAGKFALKLALPVLVFYIVPYLVIWGGSPFDDLTLTSTAKLLVLIIPGAILHELIHGLFFALFSKGGFNAVNFGFKWEYLTPYCHCKVPVRIWQYLVSGLAPLFLLGMVPAILGIWNTNFHFVLFGLFFTWAASGDILSAWMLRKFGASMWVQDHNEELGFIVYPGPFNENTN